MKIKLSVSMESSTVNKIESVLNCGLFRNKSHLIEYAVNQYIKRDNK